MIDKLKSGPKGPPIPQDLQDQLNRDRKQMERDANKRRLSYRFWADEQYWYLTEKGALNFQSTVTSVNGGGKPPHRIRNRYNFIRPIVEGKVSAATQRVPSYEVSPSTTDPGDVSAARVSEKVALYGYDKWGVRRATTKAVVLALVEGEGFLMPYFDPNVGPFIEEMAPDGLPVMDKKGNLSRVGRGEIKLKCLSGNEVFWQEGCDFEESPHYWIEQARPIKEVERTPGYVGGKLAPDATTSDVPTHKQNTDMVLVTEYLERPCPEYPDGRRIIMANQRVIVPVEQYPVRGPKGEVLDEPPMHRLSYVVDPLNDRDRGLVWALIDLQRTINDCWNKILEWKNRALNPQMIAPIGSMKGRKTDEPGVINYYNPVGGMKPEWEQSPPVPRELFQILEMAIQHMRAIAADVDVQAEPDLAARTVQAVIEQSRQRWQSFIADLAEFHSKVMRSCLSLVQRHYTEPRLITIKGTFGPERIQDFLGADLRGQVDVKVLPGSIETKSRRTLVEETTLFAQNGWITPQAAMARINGGVGENLANSHEYDIAMVNTLIERIKQGPEVLFSVPDRFDSTLNTYVPGWMPRKGIDNVDIWLQVFGVFLKTESFFQLEPGMQEAAYQVHAALQLHQAQEEAERMMAEQMKAEGLGMANAAKDPVKPMPSQPKPELS